MHLQFSWFKVQWKVTQAKDIANKNVTWLTLSEFGQNMSTIGNKIDNYSLVINSLGD